jgi:hypothetical protein
MGASPDGGGKLPGKTRYSGRRREVTRRSGFRVHAETSGGEFRRHTVRSYKLEPADTIEVRFRIAGHSDGDLLGYGLWFSSNRSIDVILHGGPDRRTLSNYGTKVWNKVGSIWLATGTKPTVITVQLRAVQAAVVALYEPLCGRIKHKHLDDARAELLPNMYQFAPEAIFGDDAVDSEVDIDTPDDTATGEQQIILKSCNRCGRYLPVNIPAERHQLSFSNHCVAEHRRPCKHGTFGRLRNIENSNDVLQLEYGFQLECRFCKKFEVNAAHNPKRTGAQMKEDGARRRAFELLLAELYEGTPQLKYRHAYGSELADDVWRRFGKRCFNCQTPLASPREMHLDHTRPLALLWPLDHTATALCGPCNSEKRDRAPADFYSEEKLGALSKITGIALDELKSTRPNDEALAALKERLEWFFGMFLKRDEMVKERDGKVVGELVLKALTKVFARSQKFRGYDPLKVYELKGSGRLKPR